MRTGSLTSATLLAVELRGASPMTLMTQNASPVVRDKQSERRGPTRGHRSSAGVGLSIFVGTVAMLLMISPALATTDLDAASPCADQLSPVHSTAPKLPARLHNEFVGHAVVSYVVDAAGEVHLPTIISSEWRPIGRSTGQPTGYTEAILTALAQWRFAPQGQACRNQTKLEFSFSDPTASVESGLGNLE